MSNTEQTPVVSETVENPAPKAKATKTAKPKAKVSKPKAKATKAKVSKTTKPKAKPKAKAPRKLAGEASRSVIPLEVAKSYQRDTEHKTAGGNPSVDNGDKVATLLRGKPIEVVYELVAKKCETPVKALREKYGHLNVGMQRMNLGNKLRAAL